MQLPLKTVCFGDRGPAGETIASIYGPERLEMLARTTQLYPRTVTRSNLANCLPDLGEVEAMFCTWGMFPLTSAELDQMPRLRAVFYAAGTVGYFAHPFMERGVTLVSAWAANAVPVAEFTLAQILLANKGFFLNQRDYRGAQDYSGAFRGQGNYGATVAVLGAGQIGRKLIELLRPFRLRVIVHDPFLSYKAAEGLGVEKVGLAEAFSCGDVVSNHLANVPATVGLLNATLFESLKGNATFINTGRGATVNHHDLDHVFSRRKDLTALLDVTDPEPLPGDSSLRTLPNVVITSHIAGSIGTEVGRVADWILEEFEAWRQGLPLRYEITSELVATLA